MCRARPRPTRRSSSSSGSSSSSLSRSQTSHGVNTRCESSLISFILTNKIICQDLFGRRAVRRVVRCLLLEVALNRHALPGGHEVKVLLVPHTRARRDRDNVARLVRPVLAVIC